MICFSFLDQVFGDFTFQRNFCYVDKGQNLCVCVVFPVPRAAGDRPTLSHGGSREMLPRAELQQRRYSQEGHFPPPTNWTMYTHSDTTGRDGSIPSAHGSGCFRFSGRFD